MPLDKKAYAKLKADPVRYAAYLAEKQRQYAARCKKRKGYQGSRIKRWRTRNPERGKLMRSVNFAVHRAVRNGKLIRPKSCPRCGRETRIEAHHHKGYAKEHWLDVEWLCRRCHNAVHHP